MNTENSDTQKEILETLQKMNRVLMVIEENQQTNSKLLEEVEEIKSDRLRQRFDEIVDKISNMKWTIYFGMVAFFIAVKFGGIKIIP